MASRAVSEATNPLPQPSDPLVNDILCSVTSSTISSKIIYNVCSTYSHTGTGASGTGTGTSGAESELCSMKGKNAEQPAGRGTSGTGTTASRPES